MANDCFVFRGGAWRLRLAGVVLLSLQWAVPATGQVRVQAPSLPPGLLGSTYGTVPTEGGGLRVTAQVYTAQGGVAPYSFRVSNGSLPTGVSLNANGALQGAPAATGTFRFTVEASDANRQTGTVESAITVGPRAPLGLSGRVGTPFHYQRLCGLDAAAQATYSYAINGNPPPGISFNPANSTFAGTPAEEGTYVVNWGCASQAMGLSFSFEIVFTIGGPVRVTLNPATVGQPWSFAPSRLTPGQPPYRFAVEGELPGGLVLTSPSQGTISGTPVQSGSYSWNLRRTDAAQSELIAFYDLRVNDLNGFLPSLSAWNVVRQAGTPPVSVDVYVNSNPAALPYELRVESEGGEWLSAGPATGEAPVRLRFTADVSGLSPGAYKGKVIIAPGGGGPGVVEIPVNLEVQPAGPARLRFSRTSLEMNPGARDSVMVTNVGGDTARGLEVYVRSQGSWLKSAALSREELKPGQSLNLDLESESVSLQPGNYAGFARISAANISSVSLPVTLKVRPGVYCYFDPPVLTFKTTALNTESGPLTKTSKLVFANAEQAAGPVSWKMHQLSWLGFVINPQLPMWLKLSPMEGSGETNIEVSVDPVGFPRDVWIGEHLLGEAFGVKGCKNDLEIRVKVTGAEEPIIMQEDPVWMTYLPENPKLPVDPRLIVLTPVNPESLDYSIVFDRDLFSIQASGYFEVSPREGRVRSESAQIEVRSLAVAPALPMQAAPYRPTFIMYFSKAGTVFGTKFLTYSHWVLPFPRSARVTDSGGKAGRLADEAGCQPKTLEVTIGLPAPLSLQVGEPQELTAVVVSDCGQFVKQGAVEADFSTGEAPVALSHVGDGRWRGVWIPRVEGESVSIRVRALAGEVEGEASIGAAVLDSSTLPVLSGPGAVRNSASQQAQGLIATGMRIAIQGRRLATGQADLDLQRPPRETLAGARVLFGDITLPLLSANENQLLALVPPGVELPPEANLVVATERGVSEGLALLAGTAAPGIYTVDGSGGGQGLVYWVNAEGQRILADEKNPAPQGADCVLVATGLGGVRQNPDAAGEPVTVSIGEVEVEAVQVAPREGRPGNYDVHFKLPGGAGSGSQVPVSLSAAGVLSRTVTFAVQ